MTSFIQDAGKEVAVENFLAVPESWNNTKVWSLTFVYDASFSIQKPSCESSSGILILGCQ